MKAAIAVHEVHIGKDQFAPGTLFNAEDTIVDPLMRIGAAREPTDQELAFHDAVKSRKESISSDRAKLEQQAAELGVKFNKNVSDITLANRIEAAMAAAEAAAAAAPKPEDTDKEDL